MRDPRLDKLAGVLVEYSTRVKAGDDVAIIAEPHAMAFVEAVYEAALGAGGNPYYVARCDALTEILVARGHAGQIAHTPTILRHMAETADVRIVAWAEPNTKYLSRHDPAKVALIEQARRPIMKTVLDRAAKGQMRWVGTQYPVQSAAQDAEMSLRQYEDFVYRAGLLHLPDPVGAWGRIHERQERVREHLQGRRLIRFRVPATEHDDGTDLRVDVSKATWINCAGHENFPDGEVFAGPTGVDGHVCFNYPAVYHGREVHGVRLAFRDGRVVDATARKGEDFLHQMLDQDAGARVLGEIAIGTNYEIREFTRNTLFDEKIGGTFHAAVGAGYPESGSTNESGLHWDMVCDLRPRPGAGGASTGGAVIEADGEAILRDGRFVRPEWPAPE